MSEYIEVERLEQALREYGYGNDGNLQDIIDSLSRVDLTEVVRCEDCNCFKNGFCNYHGAFVHEEWFCWNGEKG